MKYDIIFQNTTPKEIQVASSELMKKGRLAFNNYYGVNENDNCEIFSADNTLLIRKKEFHYFRLYVMAIDETELSLLLKKLGEVEYVINIPSKTSIDNWDLLLRNSGFDFLDVYSRFYNKAIPYYPSSIDTFATEDEIEDIASLLYNNFSVYTDHLPTKEEIMGMVAERQIITDHKDGKVCGVMIYTITGNKGYFNAWIDKGENALSLLFKAKNILIENGVKYCYYWIKDTNKPVIKIHTLLGGKPDGLKDYTYIKR